MSAEAAIDPSSPPIFEDLGSNVLSAPAPTIYGDVDGAFARADQVLRVHFTQHRHQHVPMEGRAIIADFDPATGRLTVHVACQGVHLVRTTLATRLGLDPERGPRRRRRRRWLVRAEDGQQPGGDRVPRPWRCTSVDR